MRKAVVATAAAASRLRATPAQGVGAAATAAALRACGEKSTSSDRRFSSSSAGQEEKRWWPARGAAGSSSSCSPCPPSPPSLRLRSPCVAVWGADTGVGKTLVSAGLAYASSKQERRGILYVKPVQTGFPNDDDAATVAGAAASARPSDPECFVLDHREHAAEAAAAESAALSSPGERGAFHQPPLHRAVTLHAWKLPASPHAAVEREGRPVSDARLVGALAGEIESWERQYRGRGSARPEWCGSPPLFDSLVVAETAGGTLSPTPSGSLQADAWRPLRLPALLVASPRRGGVSATLAAAESLIARGHGVPIAAVVLAGGSGESSSTSSSSSSSSASAHDDEAVPAGHVEALEKHLGALGVPLVVLPRARPPSSATSAMATKLRHPLCPRRPDNELEQWLADSGPQLQELLRVIDEHHAARTQSLRSLASDAARVTWWPFTQHSDLIKKKKKEEEEEEKKGTKAKNDDDSDDGINGAVFAIDARSGEHFISVQKNPERLAKASPCSDLSLDPFYDACASWWTQGAAAAATADGDSSSAAAARLARAIAAAAARYGHVIHPEAAHEPGVAAAEALLGGKGPGRGWASRVFWSDDGSTAVEVGLKMAFRASRSSRNQRLERQRKRSGKEPAAPADVVVLALSGGYHGDTLGAMDATEPSVFNGEGQTPWYRGRGLFLEPPTAAMERAGEWKVRWLDGGGGESDDDDESDVTAAKGRVVDVVGPQGLSVLFSRDRLHSESSEIVQRYKKHIREAIEEFESAPSSSSSKNQNIIGALLFEPCLQGAGGMRLVDPAFQVALCDVARELRIPIVADEVFSGLWRLGAASGCELLGITPDVACFAKLLTGGTVPLAATLATNEVFEAFSEGGKAGALLHGHSYSAHAIGCAAAVESLKMLSEPSSNPSMCFSSSEKEEEKKTDKASTSSSSCSSPSTCASSPRCPPGSTCSRLLPLWDQDLLVELAGHSRVRRAHAIGTVLAVELRQGRTKKKKTQQQGASNYTATASARVAASLRRKGIYARPLGDVVYLMVTPVSAVGVGKGLQLKLLEALNDDESDSDSSDSD